MSLQIQLKRHEIFSVNLYLISYQQLLLHQIILINKHLIKNMLFCSDKQVPGKLILFEFLSCKCCMKHYSLLQKRKSKKHPSHLIHFVKA